ncbi:hypothetical protein SARC_05898 [Sphaeroforma arctica JP610]|uniref:Uncharacterized protein n=1 Tax=Sphaeroforma arctica JP610 TaxID=667725 RepID=A0A0L0G0Q9_9EUKA|nr:hypothetical protein SARC_05898 [Sphaeroforma arctica JP610]KNC81793.1 hypothetical protein SARC_05898 [Sphaeroforma arctica JP610]|eukprot:XP_014155695.1 hypothetical protein SARC_05898 [Sphaeroforma arctica JP610]
MPQDSPVISPTRTFQPHTWWHVLLYSSLEVALADVRKEIAFCRKVGVPIIGVIENMSGFVCPGCKTESQIFPATTGGAALMSEKLDCPFLGRVSLDPRVGQCCDEGKPFIETYPDTIVAKQYLDIVEQLKAFCAQ